MNLAVYQWVLLGVAAAIVGVSKTALPGSASVAVAFFIAALPSKQSTATLLVLFMVGDALALLTYRRQANWAVLLRLIPAVLLGVTLGAVFLAFANDSWARRVIGVILLVVVTVTLTRRWLARDTVPPTGRPHPVATIAYGSLGGFTTMVANAGGPVMSMYFLAARFPVQLFLGTTAWFFAAVNVVKLPFAIGLGLLTPEGLLIDAILAPAVILAGLGGRLLAKRISQKAFEWIIIVLTTAGAIYLIFF